MASDQEDASKKIDERIADIGGWRGEVLGQVRQVILDAEPGVVEEWKWVKPTNPGVPVWSHNGGICTGETYKTAVKFTFYKGASIDDPDGLFTSSLEGKVRRAIDFHEGDPINKAALKALIQRAVALNAKGK